MSGQETTTAESAAAGPGRRPVIGSRLPGPSPRRTAERRPWWIWAAPFALVLAVLVVRSRFLFTVSFYEQGDAGANSILIQQAMHGTLLIGNYSREGFNHPGPAYMYVQAAGQWLFLYLLHLVPTAWNAHVLAVFTLNSAFVAMVTGIVYGWTRSLRGAAVCLAVVLGFVATRAVDPQPRLDALDVRPGVHRLPDRGRVRRGRRVARPVDLDPDRLVPDSRARLLPVLRAGDPRRRGGRGDLAARPARQPAGLPPPADLDSGGGHQRGLRAADRGQPGPALAGQLRQVLLVQFLLAGRRARARAGSALRAVVLVARRPHVGGGAGAGGVVRGRDRRGVVADARCDAPVPGRPARRQRGLDAGLRLLRRGRDRYPVALLHRLLLLLRADPHAAGHRGGRGARPARRPWVPCSPPARPSSASRRSRRRPARR